MYAEVYNKLKIHYVYCEFRYKEGLLILDKTGRFQKFDIQGGESGKFVKIYLPKTKGKIKKFRIVRKN